MESEYCTPMLTACEPVTDLLARDLDIRVIHCIGDFSTRSWASNRGALLVQSDPDHVCVCCGIGARLVEPEIQHEDKYEGIFFSARMAMLGTRIIGVTAVRRTAPDSKCLGEFE